VISCKGQKMKTVELTVCNPTGLHARPAKVFVNLAKQYQCDIWVSHGEKRAKAKSMLSVLTLGVVTGGKICIEAEGEDEEAAIQALEEAVRSGLGE